MAVEDLIQFWEEKHRQNRYEAMKDAIYSRIYISTRRHRSASPQELLGCDIDWFLTEYAPKLMRIASDRYGVELKVENFGRTWHWDHCEPVSSFDLSDPEQQRYCFGWGNLRPLPAKVNLAKHAKAPDLNDVFVGA